MDIAGSKGAGVLGTGSGAVSPPKLYTTVSGNGLVRRVGQSSVPFGISKSADLQASPLEDYVKLLVRSELASEGIPMNEPFQVNEAQALGNAEEYLKKTTKGITEWTIHENDFFTTLKGVKKSVLAGVEPATFRLTAECSNQLS
jgi:hypothetical protein